MAKILELRNTLTARAARFQVSEELWTATDLRKICDQFMDLGHASELEGVEVDYARDQYPNLIIKWEGNHADTFDQRM